MNRKSIRMHQTISCAGSKPDHDVDLLDVFVLVSQDFFFIALFTVLAFLLTALITGLIPPRFTSIAQILPPVKPPLSLPILLNQRSALAVSSGNSGPRGGTPDMYVGVLRSRAVTDPLVQRFNLASIYGVRSEQKAKGLLEKNTRINAAKDGLIVITVEDRSPQLASDLANGYVAGLYRVISRLAVEEATQRRIFYEKTLNDEKKQLARAETEWTNIRRKTGLIEPVGQIRETLEESAQIRAEIVSREVEQESMHTFATDQNPHVVALKSEIASLKQHLSSLEDGRSLIENDKSIIAPSQLPASALEYLRRWRDVRYFETIVQLVSEQYDAARLDQARPVPAIQVVDRAIPSDTKSSPRSLLFSSGIAGVAFCIAVFLSMVRRAWRRYRSITDSLARIESLYRL
jgi:uncharacterized protein involved in exopolysaccharide biosynthesis